MTMAALFCVAGRRRLRRGDRGLSLEGVIMINREDLHTLDLSSVDSGETIPRPRPGDVLRHDFMEPLNLSAYALAKSTGVPANRITGILHGRRAITADT